mgnify:CR=1 FL=1
MHSNGKLTYKSTIKVDKQIADKIMKISGKMMGILYLSALTTVLYLKIYAEKLST